MNPKPPQYCLELNILEYPKHLSISYIFRNFVSSKKPSCGKINLAEWKPRRNQVRGRSHTLDHHDAWSDESLDNGTYKVAFQSLRDQSHPLCHLSFRELAGHWLNWLYKEPITEYMASGGEQNPTQKVHKWCYAVLNVQNVQLSLWFHAVVLVVLREPCQIDGHSDVDEWPGGASGLSRPITASSRWKLFRFPKESIHTWSS